MNLNEINTKIIDYLIGYKPLSIGIFGSYARGESGPGSDIDILVELGKGVGLLEFVRMNNELSELLGIRVDLVSKAALKNEKLKKYIGQDLQVIYHV